MRADRTQPPPPWADDERATGALTPAWDRALLAVDAQRVLVAGLPRLDLAIALANAGRFVTICDLAPDEVAKAHARLDPEVAGRIQLVPKPYGDAAFAPSSFELIAWCDTLHRWEEPQWVAHKMARELKVDGVLHARLWVRGPFDVGETALQSDDGAPGWSAAALGPAFRQLRANLPHLGTAGARWLLDAAGRDAVDRGAWQRAWTPRLDASAQIEAIDSRLRIESIGLVAAERPAWAAIAAHGRGPLKGHALTHLATGLELGPAALRSVDDARIVTVIARRALGDHRMVAGRTR